jgi:hypothetical protein
VASHSLELLHRYLLVSEDNAHPTISADRRVTKLFHDIHSLRRKLLEDMACLCEHHAQRLAMIENFCNEELDRLINNFDAYGVISFHSLCDDRISMSAEISIHSWTVCTLSRVSGFEEAVPHIMAMFNAVAKETIMLSFRNFNDLVDEYSSILTIILKQISKKISESNDRTSGSEHEHGHLRVYVESIRQGVLDVSGLSALQKAAFLIATTTSVLNIHDSLLPFARQCVEMCLTLLSGLVETCNGAIETTAPGTAPVKSIYTALLIPVD